MNMCERIYFTVDVSGTSNLFSRFVHPWLAWWGSQPGCHMVVMIFFWSQELYHDNDDCD